MAGTRGAGAGLPTRALGGTGMEITRVGFGSYAIGGAGWAFAYAVLNDAELSVDLAGEILADSISAIRHAVEHGINWIDTAAVYGLGHSEEIVAEALEAFPREDRPYVFTKCGLVWDPDNPTAVAKRIGKPESIRRELEGRSMSETVVSPAKDLEEEWHAA